MRLQAANDEPIATKVDFVQSRIVQYIQRVYLMHHESTIDNQQARVVMLAGIAFVRDALGAWYADTLTTASQLEHNDVRLSLMGCDNQLESLRHRANADSILPSFRIATWSNKPLEWMPDTEN